MAKRYRRMMIALLILSILGLSGFAPAQQDESTEQAVSVLITQVDTSQFPLVTVYVSVVDEAGEPVGVDAADFVLTENGEPISAHQIQGIGEVGPLTTLLVMDVSGSMNSAGKLSAAKVAAQSYVDQMRTGDQTGLLIFNTSITYVQEVTTNQQALMQTIDGLRAKDDTAMYDALIEAIDVLENYSGRKAIILLADGLDNRSVKTPQDVIASIGPQGLSISIIGLGDPTHGRGAQSALDQVALTSLAQSAGGIYGYAEDEQALKEVYARYGRALRSEYVITYTSPSQLRDGVNRALSVSLASTLTDGQRAVYNPGGLLPEIAEPVPWLTFFAILFGLIVLMFVPTVIGWAFAFADGVQKKVKPEKKIQIKLKD